MAEAGLPMPQVRHDRKPAGWRVRTDVQTLLAEFCATEKVKAQETVDLAILEFLNARGYFLPDQKPQRKP